MDRLEGEVAIVTGSTAGLGREVARVFAAEGASVVVTGRNEERGASVAAAIAEVSSRVAFVRADLASEDECGALVAATVDRFGPVTVLVNNAVSDDAIARDSAVGNMDVATWRLMWDVNVVAPAVLCRESIPHMRAAGHGSIVNVSSRAAERGTPNLAAYTASKGALNALARSISIDHAREGIRCNTVQPGYVLNDRRDEGSDDARMARYAAMHLTRMITATDVAMACLFYASRESETITGTLLQVDGGSSGARGLTLG